MKELMQAISNIQNEMPALDKEANNPFFKSKYTPLFAIQEHLKPLCREHGIVLIDMPTGDSELTTTVYHLETGQELKTSVKMEIAKADPQKVGSAITYYRRYNRVALFDIKLNEDDDGNKASGNEKKATEPVKKEIKKDTDSDARAKCISYLYKKLKINTAKMKTSTKEEQAKLYEPVKEYISNTSGISYEDFMKAKGTTLEMAISNIMGGE